MRNLKRVLSLALALVMVLGMMVITTSAADFTDAEEITYTEAADVLSAIGVITGDNGYFAPDRTLTREEGAALICYLLMGKDAADKLVGSGNFADVKADRWSAGEIDYCANLGIIKGYTDAEGKTVFNPKGELTAVAFGRMLLGALGYDGDIEGYTGGNWASSIAADMIDAGLDVRGVDMGAQLTREQAAQMALQALEATMVKYATKGTSITVNGMNIVTGASEAEARTWGAATNKYDYNGAVNGTETGANDSIQFVEKYFSDLTKAYSEANGRQGYVWNLVGTPAPVSEFVITDKVLATSNDGTSWANLTDVTKPFYVGRPTNGTITYYVNGTEKTGGDITTAQTSIGTTGVIAEFIDTLPYDGKYDVVNIINKTVATLTGDAATKEVKGNDTQVIVPGVPSMGAFGTTYTVKTVAGYEGLKKGDVVLWYDSDGVRYFEKAEIVSGKVSGLTNGDPVVNGTAYENSGLAGASNAWSADYKNSYDFYLDNSGAIVKAVKTTDEVADVYAVPVEIKWVTGGQIDEDNFAQAKLLFTDGTTKIVAVSKVGGKTIVAQSATPTSTQVKFGDGSGTAYAITVDTFYTYTTDKDGNYELTIVAPQNDLDTTAISTGAANFDGTSATPTNNNVGTTATTFIVKTTSGPKVTYTVYNGINEVPNVTVSAATDGTVIYDKTGLASYVYVDAASTSGSSRDYVVIVPDRTGRSFDNTAIPNAMGTGIDHYVVKAIVNGVEQDIKLKTLSIADTSSPFATYTEDVAQDVLYQVATIDADGVITGLNAVSTTTGVKVVAGTLATGSASYTTDAKTVFYYIDDTGAVSTLDNTSVVADKTDAVYVAKSANGKAEVVYIMQVVSNTATLTSVEYTKDTTTGQTVTSIVAPSNSAKDNGTAAGASVATKVVTIDKVTVADEATYTIDKTAFTAGAASSTETVVITITAEDGKTTGTYTITFTAS